MNLFAISSVLVFFASALAGLFVYSQNRKARVNRNWFLLCLAVAFWGLGLYGVTTAQTEPVAIAWQNLLDLSAIWIPVAGLLFAGAFASEQQGKTKKLLLEKISAYGGIVFAVFLTILNFTPLYKQGMITRFGFYWINPGPLYVLFPLFFGIAALVFLYILGREASAPENSALRRSRALSLAVAGFLGFGGGVTNFFPQLFNIYPFGNYFVILFTVIVGYSIVRQRLFDTKIIATQIFAAAMSLIFLLNVLTSESLSQWFLSTFLFVAVLAFSMLLVQSVYREVEQREHIERLASDLRIANEKLKELDKMKTQFLSIASHDLRAPLTIIRNFMSLLLDGSYGKLPPAAEESMHQVFDRATDMAKSVETYLNVSRIEQGRMKYEFIDVELLPLVKNAVTAFTGNAEKKGLKMAATYDPALNGVKAKLDVAKINEVLNNLLDNTIKYTPKGEIWATLERRGNIARFSLKDTGVGMSQETIGKLFKLFSTADNSRKVNTTSTGLGLYITKAHVEAHGGKIWAESEGEGKGSTFIMELPLLV